MRLRYSPRLVGATFLTVSTACTACLALLWGAGTALGHQDAIAFIAQAPPDGGPPGQVAGQGVLIVGIGSLAGMLVNALVADRKARADAAALVAVRKLDADDRFAALQMRSLEQLGDARVEIAGLKAELAAYRILPRPGPIP